MLSIVTQLLTSFKDNGIHFCHWKSNMDLVEACDGEGDLDLLFLKSQYASVTEILMQLGFKRLESNIDRQYPGLEDYIAYDRQSGCFLHLQAHYQLVTGQPLTKNYHFPIEALMFDNLRTSDVPGLPIPNRNLELLLHVCRTFIKLGPKLIFRSAHFRRHKQSATKELNFLMPDGEQGLDRTLIESAMPNVPYSLFRQAFAAIANDCSAVQWFFLRRKMLAALKLNERRTRSIGLGAWVLRRIYLWSIKAITGKPPKRMPATGGFGIAIIGSDGAGKSTAINSLGKWLGSVMQVEVLHMGRPKVGLKTRVMSYMARFVERVSKQRYVLPRPGHLEGSQWPGHLAWIPIHLYIGLAEDRLRCYAQAKRVIGSGGIVICDRFPLPYLSLMDSPRLASVIDSSSPFCQRYIKKENAIYARMVRLDLTLLLKVSEEVAAKRQPGDGEAYVKARAKEVLALAANPPHGINIIDAEQPVTEVERAIREIVWATI